jgi:hypothetical protein
MLRRVGSVVVLAILLAACSSTGSGAPVPSGRSKAQVDCERNGGAWREVLKVCEYRQPS